MWVTQARYDRVPEAKELVAIYRNLSNICMSTYSVVIYSDLNDIWVSKVNCDRVPESVNHLQLIAI